MKYKEFSKKNIKNFREDLQAEMDKIAKKFGLTKIKVGDMTYNGSECNMKVAAYSGNTSPSNAEYMKYANALKRHMQLRILFLEYLNKEVRIMNESTSYTLLGSVPRQRKQDLILKNNSTGKLVRVPSSFVLPA